GAALFRRLRDVPGGTSPARPSDPTRPYAALTRGDGPDPTTERSTSSRAAGPRSAARNDLGAELASRDAARRFRRLAGRIGTIVGSRSRGYEGGVRGTRSA